MKSSISAKWFLSLILGASLITFTMTGCGSKDGPAAAVEEAAEDVEAATPDHPEHPK